LINKRNRKEARPLSAYGGYPTFPQKAGHPAFPVKAGHQTIIYVWVPFMPGCLAFRALKPTAWAGRGVVIGSHMEQYFKFYECQVAAGMVIFIILSVIFLIAEALK